MKLSWEEFFKREYCGARTRAGTPCKRKDLFENGRCRLHGGLSTGPKTEAGKKKSAQNGFKKKRPADETGYFLDAVIGV